MKKTTFFKTLLVAVGLCAGSMNAWADATTYNFEDGNVRFSAYNSAKITVAIQENSGPNSDSKAVKFAYKSKGNHNFAYLDFSSLVENASSVNVAFDFYVTSASGHDLISLADADYHTGANGGFDSGSNTGYGSNGAIFNLGCYRADKTDDFAINSSKKTALTSTCLGNWCHADITVDNVGKTVSYTITRCDDTALDAAASATGVSFLNSSAVKCTQIDVYMGATSSTTPIYIDNLVITPTVIATNHSYVIKAVSGGTTLKTFAAGMTAEGSTYSSYVPKVINYGGSYYVLSDASLSNFNASYTMSTANVTKEITYTLDESIVYYMEGESSGSLGTKVSNERYSNGSAGRGLNGNTFNIYTIPSAGKYTINSAVCNNNVNSSRTFAFYKNNSENVLQTYSDKYPSVTQVMTDGTRTSDAAILSTGDVIKFYASDTQMILDYVIIRQTDKDVTAAIADCKTYETSDEFATHIDGLYAAGNLTTIAEVYAAHTAWQIAQADASSSLDYTKVIRNAAVADADATDWEGASTYNAEYYDGAPDHYFIDKYGAQMWATQTIYGLPAGKYQVKVATRAAANTYTHVYVNNGSYDISTAKGHAVGNIGNTLGNGWDWTYVPFEITETTNILLGFYADARNNKWAGCDDWHLYKVTADYPVEVSEAGWATLYTPYSLDFSTTGLKVYTATLSENTVTLTEVTTIPAYTGVVLKGDQGNYNIPLATSSSTAKGDLKGSVTWATDYSDSYNYYYLALNNEGEAQFTVLNEGGSIAAGKAYLQTNKGQNAKLRVVFAGDASGIEEIATDGTEDDVLYNVAGQQVSKNYKGIVINKKGQKYFNK